MVILIFGALLFFNVPIAISLGISSLIYIMFFSPVPVNMVIQALVTGLDSFTLLGIPFFILAGDIMMHGGISRRLIRFSTALLGGIIGSMGMVTVFASLIFGSISGSGPATVASIGKIAIPAMIKEKYDRGFACALAACSGSFGPLIPPSIVMIMYGVVAQQSITHLFLAGIIPGIIVAISLMTFAYFASKKYKFGLRMNPELKETLEVESLSVVRTFIDAIWAILCPLIILGGIYTGAFTPTEAAIVACVYALIIGIFVHREIKPKDLPKIFKNAVNTNGTVLILVSCATAFGRVLAIEQVPAALGGVISGISDNVYIILLVINLLVLAIGLFMESLAALIILTPVLLPIVTSMGVDPIHFGIIITMNLAIGQSTPPTGVNLFVASQIGECRVEDVLRWLLPAVLVLIVVLLILTYIPAISLFLPSLLLP